MNGRYAYDGLDRILHEKARLGLLTCLASHPEGLLFNDLKELCNLTDGNLSRHLQVLQQNNVVEIYKSFENCKRFFSTQKRPVNNRTPASPFPPDGSRLRPSLFLKRHFAPQSESGGKPCS